MPKITASINSGIAAPAGTGIAALPTTIDNTTAKITANATAPAPILNNPKILSLAILPEPIIIKLIGVATK